MAPARRDGTTCGQHAGRAPRSRHPDAVRRPEPLPEQLRGRVAFSSSEARALGATKARLEASDLTTPFRGSRMLAGSAPTVRQLAMAYATRMQPGQFFSHATAAVLNGVPLPTPIEADPRLHVSAVAGGSRPRSRGVVGHVVDASRTGTLIIGGVPMTDAATTWCQLGAMLGVDDLVAVGDFLVTGRRKLGGPPPAATHDTLARAVELHRGSTGVAVLRAALPLVRVGPLSRRESLLRRRIVRAGLPEPEVAFVVRDARLAGFEPTVDLAYPRYRIAIEYEGDHHRVPLQFRRDIRRYERLQDVGWVVIRVSAIDVPDGELAGSEETIERIAARLHRRGRPG